MSTTHRYLIFLVSLALGFSLLLLPSSSVGQIAFERFYGGDESDGGYDVQQTRDGGYIVVGITSSFAIGLFDVYLIKTDSLGDTLWTGAYGDTGSTYGYSVRQTSDGGYIIAGATVSFGAGGWDAYLIKTDSLGDTLWTRTYGGSGDEYGYSVQQTSDGGYVIVGETSSFGAGMADVYLIKTDSVGDSLWTRTYGGTLDDKCYSVEQTWDGGYVMAGYRKPSAGVNNAVYLIKTDALGDTLWTRIYRTYGNPYHHYGRSVQQTWDGGYVVAGYMRHPSRFDDFCLVKTDSLGDTLWTGTYGADDSDQGYSVQQTWDGGYVVAGVTKSFGLGSPDVYLIETDPWGTIRWERVYGDPTYLEFGMSVQQTPDGGHIVAGYAWVDTSAGIEVYLIKTAGIGIEFHNAGVIALNSPEDSVFTDSIYAVMATVKNFGNVPETFDVIATIDGYLDTTSVSGLAPRASRQLTFKNWRVPSPDSSSYTMIVCSHAFGDIDPSNDCREKSIFAYHPTGIEEELNAGSQTTHFRLFQNNPNPFSRSTAIRYSLRTACPVNLIVYDVTGSLVETLVDGWREEGIHSMTWDGSDRPGGIYFCRLQADSFVDTKKIILLR